MTMDVIAIHSRHGASRLVCARRSGLCELSGFRWLMHLPGAGCLGAILAALPALLIAAALADEPCRILEEYHLDGQLIGIMRGAARDGRLYRVVPGSARVGFCVRHFPLQEFRGEFTDIMGGLAMPTATQPDGQALLLIHTAALEVSNEELAPLVKGSQFMDTSRFTEILFIGKVFEWENPLQGYIHGDLTMRGKTRPVIVNVDIDVLDEGPDGLPGRLFLKGAGQVSRYEFDMRTHTIIVSETVRLCLGIELARFEP